MLNLADLGRRVFKSEAASEIIDLVINNQDAKTSPGVLKVLSDAGFSLERVSKAEGEEAMLVKQATAAEDAEQFLVRLSEEMVLVVKGFNPYMVDGKFSEMVQSQGFYQGLSGSFDVAYGSICQDLLESTTQEEAIASTKTLLDQFSTYIMSLIKGLPVAAFKADLAVQDFLQKRRTELSTAIKGGESTTLETLADLLKKAPLHLSDPEWAGMSMGEKVKWLMDSTNTKTTIQKSDYNDADLKDEMKGMTLEEKKKHLKGKGMSDSEAEAYCQKNDEPAPAPAPDPAPVPTPEAVVKSEVASALQGVMATLKEMSTQITVIAQKQEEQGKAIQGVIQKSDALETQVKGVVIAQPVVDHPAPGTVAKKVDDDPRTGAFDTAFLPKRR